MFNNSNYNSLELTAAGDGSTLRFIIKARAKISKIYNNTITNKIYISSNGIKKCYNNTIVRDIKKPVNKITRINPNHKLK